jgi:hypothetical protein
MNFLWVFMLFRQKIATLVLLSLSSSVSLKAAAYTWTNNSGTGNSLWDGEPASAANWTPNGFPNAVGDHVTFPGNSPTILNSNPTVGDITFSSTTPFTLNLNNFFLNFNEDNIGGLTTITLVGTTQATIQGPESVNWVAPQGPFGIILGIGSVLNFQADWLNLPTSITLAGAGTVNNSGSFSNATSQININNGSNFVNNGTVLTNLLTSTGGGGTFVNNGTLGSQANATSVTPGTALVRVTNQGMVIPGQPVVGGDTGTVTIGGSYTQTSSGTLLINFNGATSSQLIVSGNANLAGTLQIGEKTGTQIIPGQNYTILQANGGLNGRFAAFEDLRTPYLNPHVAYSSNAVQVSFSPTIFPGDDQVFDENGRELPSGKRGGYVNLSRPVFSSVNETFTRLTRQMGNLRSHFAKPVNEKMAASLKQMPRSKEVFSIIPVKTDQTLSSILDEENLLEEASKSLFAATEQEEGVTKEKRERLTESLGTSQERPWNFYVGPKGMTGDVKSEGQTQGYKLWSAGAFTGFDYAFSEVGVGLLAEYERMDARVGKKWGKFTIDSIHADAYATYAPSQLPELSFNGIVGGGYEWYDIHRNLNLANPLQFKGTPHGSEFDAFLGTEYAFRNSVFSAMPDRLQIIPEVAVQYMYLHIDDYSENGHQLFEMHFAKQNVKSLRTNLGFRINYTWQTKDVDFSPEAHFSWQREYLDKERTFGVTPVEFPNFGFDVTVSEMGRNTALAGLDLLVTLYGRHGLEAGYDFEYNSQYHTHMMYMSYNIRF